MRNLILPPMLALFLGFCVSGCAAIEQNPMTARLIVEQATMRYIQSQADWPATAARVLSAAEAVQAAASGEDLTLAQLRQIALDAAGLDSLSPADRALATSLIDTVAMVVEERIGQGALDGLDELTTLRSIMAWAIGAARTYTGDPA